MKKCVSAAALRATLSAALVCAASVSAFAQSIPSPWLARDVGAPTLSGSATYNSGIFTLDADFRVYRLPRRQRFDIVP